MKVICNIKGGLGNQMFQYAHARALQLKNDAEEIVLDIEDCERNSVRPFALDALQLCDEITILRDNTYDKYKRDKNAVLRVLQKTNPRAVFNKYKKKNVFIWDEDSYIEICPKNDNDIYLNGYWQSEKYFSEVKNTIVHDFTFKKQPNEDNKKYMELIHRNCVICIHIRLGDYLYPENWMTYVCKPSYYLAGVQLLKSRIDNPLFMVFSDEIDKAKRMLEDYKDVRLMFIEGSRNNFDDLFLMSQCHHFIISNSSFSWWAQYLSTNQDKIVCAPKQWAVDGKYKDIYMAGWEVL